MIKFALIMAVHWESQCSRVVNDGSQPTNIKYVLGKKLEFLTTDLVDAWELVYPRGPNGTLKVNFPFLQKIDEMQKDQTFLNAMGGIEAFGNVVKNKRIAPPCSTCRPSDGKKYLNPAPKLFESFKWFVSNYSGVDGADGMIGLLQTGQFHQIAEIAQLSRLLKNNETEFAAANITGFDQDIIGTNNRYDIGLGLLTSNGTLVELKSYSKCSIEGVCGKKSEATEDDEDVENYVIKPISQKAQFSLEGQFGAYLRSEFAVSNTQLRYVFDERKLLSKHGYGEYADDKEALKAIKGEFRKVFRGSNDDFLIYDFLIENNKVNLLESWVGRAYDATPEYFLDFKDLVGDEGENFSPIYDFIRVN